MKNFDKILIKAQEIGVGIDLECSSEKKGLFFKNNDGNDNKWDYRNEFKTKTTIDNKNYLEKAFEFYKNENTINKKDFYKHTKTNSDGNGNLSNIAGAA